MMILSTSSVYKNIWLELGNCCLKLYRSFSLFHDHSLRLFTLGPQYGIGESVQFKSKVFGQIPCHIYSLTAFR